MTLSAGGEDGRLKDGGNDSVERTLLFFVNKVSEQQARTSFTGIKRDVAVLRNSRSLCSTESRLPSSTERFGGQIFWRMLFDEQILVIWSPQQNLTNEWTHPHTIALFSNPPGQHEILLNFRISCGESFTSACESRHYTPSYVGAAAATASVLSIDWTFAHCVLLWQLQRRPWWKMSSLKRWRNDYGAHTWCWTPECSQIDAQLSKQSIQMCTSTAVSI